MLASPTFCVNYVPKAMIYEVQVSFYIVGNRLESRLKVVVNVNKEVTKQMDPGGYVKIIT